MKHSGLIRNVVKMKDILLLMSDQHSYACTGFADSRIDTPNLDRIAAQGVLFEHCYCNSPLCVPSRMSFLTGKLPSQLGIFNNDTTLPIDMPTIVHEIGRMGYHTVLIGRMHFKGDDQLHGFDEHLVGDITSQYWGTGGKNREDFGIFAGTTNRKHCLEAAGGGYSPVMAYDDMVFQSTMEFLETLSSVKDRPPVFLVVGFYGPHFPFVCETEVYRKYQGRFSPVECKEDRDILAMPVYREYMQECDSVHMRNCRAAYCGLVERLDGFTGRIYDRFTGISPQREHIFFYVSDHGEQLGKRKIFGKQTLYEEAVHVPLIAAGTGVAIGVRKEPVGLLDLSRTLVELAAREASEVQKENGTEFDSWHQGTAIDLSGSGKKRPPVKIEQMIEDNGRLMLGEAVLTGSYKVVKINNKIQVCDLETDFVQEIANTAILAELESDIKQYLLTEDEKKQLIEAEYNLRKRHERLKAWGKAKKPIENAVVTVPQHARQSPTE